LPFVVTVHNFSYGLLNPVLAYAVSCLGAFLGLRCVALARAYARLARVRWLALAAVSIGAVGIWAMHFIAMLGFTVPGEPVLYNVPMTVGSMLLAVAVAVAGLVVADFGGARSAREEQQRLAVGGAIIGGGAAAVHYMGMNAVSIPGTMSYDVPLVLLSVLIAVVAGAAALWIGAWIGGLAATVGASLVMGVAACAMHYTGMAALQVQEGATPAAAVGSAAGQATVSGATAGTFLIPLLIAVSVGAFLLTLTVSMSPSADEVRTDAELGRRLEHLQRRALPR
jgi:NO-binding membrane sensor protein with MHYT domain